MKFFAVFALVVASACAAEVAVPVYRSSEYDANILRSEFETSPEGSFAYAFETQNGIVAEAQGGQKNLNSDEPAQEVKGFARYTSPEGVAIQTDYVANEFGYQPSGQHLPTPPPVPELILRSLEYIAAHPVPVVEYVKKP